jgi:hypothetical protein
MRRATLLSRELHRRATRNRLAGAILFIDTREALSSLSMEASIQNDLRAQQQRHSVHEKTSTPDRGRSPDEARIRSLQFQQFGSSAAEDRDLVFVGQSRRR